MLSSEYKESFLLGSRVLYAVICVYQRKSEKSEKSPVNLMLETLQRELKAEIDRYQEIQIAFVYETPELDAVNFIKLEKDTPIYYKEPCSDNNPTHVWLMGMALLEHKCRQQNQAVKHGATENRLYFVMDASILRKQAQLMVQEEEGRICLHPRFEKLDVIPFLWKSEKADGDLLEVYIRGRNAENIRMFP